MHRVRVAPRGEFVEFSLDDVEQSIPGRFEQQAKRFSDRIALKTAGADLTYSELDDWANRIALALLEQRGVDLQPVGLLFGQGASSVAATLGVLKAGKVYVPLDPSYPPARIALMARLAGVGLVATDASHAGLANGIGCDRGPLVVDRLGDPGNGGSAGVEVSPDAVAYIYFTSGSTGEPKGVFDSHRNVLHNIRRYTNALTIGPDDRLTLLQSPAFSGSVSSLFCALLNGGAAYPFNMGEQGPTRLADLLIRERLTMYHSVPAIFRSVVGTGNRFPEVRVIRLEGDRASRLDVELYRRHFGPACVLANGLGTTETGLCRQYLIDVDSEPGDGILPVGYPVADMEVALLDDDGLEVESGERGEIAVRSRYLALGYWRRPDLTSAAFGPHRAGDPERLYRTGDMGRLRDDGCLEYLGRKDFQLKVLGHHVDIADVESALIGLDEVRDAVVATREGPRREAELIAYVVPRDARLLDPGALRGALAHILPRHLIPTRFVRLDTLPLGDNGKVDRRALPAPEAIEREQTPRVAPRDALEQQLVDIWEDVLERSPIGVDESFLELGGDSLAAAVIVARVESETGLRMTTAVFQEQSTIATIAEALQTGGSREDLPLVVFNPLGPLPPLFLVHDLDGEVARYTDLARQLGERQPVWALRCATEPDRIELMATRYLTEIRRIQPTGPYRLGGWCFGAVVAFEMAHQLRAGGEQVALLALIGISAWDFPRLVAPGAWRRYQLSNQTGVPQRPRLLRIARRLMRPLRVPPRVATPSVTSMSRDAFARYVPKPYPGRPVLLLSREETATYSSQPASDWAGLGTEGVDVRELTGYHDAILADSNVRELAGHLYDLLLPTAGPEAPTTG